MQRLFPGISVQERRSQKLITVTGRKEVLLHDVVPLFFNPKNPTLDVKKEDWEKLAILVIDKNVITDENVEIAFTKGNASRDDAEILRHLKDLDKLDWEIILEIIGLMMKNDMASNGKIGSLTVLQNFLFIQKSIKHGSENTSFKQTIPRNH